MKTIFKSGHLIMVPETPEEAAEIAAWKSSRDQQVLTFAGEAGTGLSLKVLGLRADVCREPINVTSLSDEQEVRLISNFAVAPFELDGRKYRTVESFWQSLKFENRLERTEVAALDGSAARRAGEAKGYGATIRYEGENIPVGTWAHWELMRRACQAKFTQDESARNALLSTKHRPLTHIVRHDSHTIPGVIMAEIWMKIRTQLQKPARGGESLAMENE